MIPGGVLVASPCPECGWPFSVYARKQLDPVAGRPGEGRIFWWYVCSACQATGEADPLI